MKVAVMQPYFMPYIGYFQLIQQADTFVIYDDIQYVKQSWINRNRILVNGKDAYISLPLKKDSDYLNVNQRFLADSWNKEQQKMLQRIKACYQKSPQFNNVYPVIQAAISNSNNNLFEFLLESLKAILAHLDINTPLVPSSSLQLDEKLKAQDKVIAICKKLKASQYTNPVGGLDLYSKKAFKENGIELFFLQTKNNQYPQFKNDFLPFLSIIDVLMFNDRAEIKQMLSNGYDLL